MDGLRFARRVSVYDWGEVLSNLRWTWIEPDGKAQASETFASPEDAIHAMTLRQGGNWPNCDRSEALTRLHRIGFKLALVEVKVVVVLVLDSSSATPTASQPS